jgi:hypothetical protein
MERMTARASGTLIVENQGWRPASVNRLTHAQPRVIYPLGQTSADPATL